MRGASRFAAATDTQIEDFMRMGKEGMTGFLAKITYIGEQRKALPTIVVKCDSAPENDPLVSCSPVLNMRVSGIDFANDDLAPIFCNATSEEVVKLIRNLSLLPNVTSAASAARYDGTYYGKYLALSLYNRIHEEEFKIQTVLGQPDAIPLLNAFGQALKSSECRQALYILWRGLGFHVGILDPDTDGDGFSDGRESSWGTDPRNADSDYDGIPDSEAIFAGIDPLNGINEPKPEPVLRITSGPFRGSRVAEVTTAPDLCSGQATIEVKYTPEGFLPSTGNLVFVQIFRRTAIKADGFRIPILPSLYIEYAGSPELDLLTIDGATVDHKVGELDPYYNGRDPQDRFVGASDKQHPGYILGDRIEPTAMLYRCRTYEEHWRALNPEGVKEICFDYETAAFCENGEGKGYFLGMLNWSWGKKRSGPITAWINSSNSTTTPPTGQVRVESDGKSVDIPVFLQDSPGQPSRFLLQVLSLWLKNHKFPWPGRDVDLNDGLRVVIPQPVTVDTMVKVRSITTLPEVGMLTQRGLEPVGLGREILGTDKNGNTFPVDYFPFGLPLTVTVNYAAQNSIGLDPKKVGIVRFDSSKQRYTTDDLYVLHRDPAARSITFCTSRFGKFAIVARR